LSVCLHVSVALLLLSPSFPIIQGSCRTLLLMPFASNPSSTQALASPHHYWSLAKFVCCSVLFISWLCCSLFYLYAMLCSCLLVLYSCLSRFTAMQLLAGDTCYQYWLIS
jgi:hypothetical protein